MKLWHESAGAELPASSSSSGGSGDGADGNFSYVPTPYFSLLVGTQRDMVGPPRSSRVPLDENNFPVCFPPAACGAGAGRCSVVWEPQGATLSSHFPPVTARTLR